MRRTFAALALLPAFVSLAAMARAETPQPIQPSALSLDDLQAALGECDVDVTVMKSRGEQLAVQLARANREIERLNAELVKAKAPPDK